MASFSRQFGTSSPVLTMPPQPIHQADFNASGFSPSYPTPFASTSRKRSRDEAAVNLEPDLPAPAPIQTSEEEWVYGPGMTLVKGNNSYLVDAASQSGTWLEEKRAAEETVRANYQSERAVLRSHKSQRMDHGLNLHAASVTSHGSSPPVGPMTIATNRDNLVIDDFTLHLGIGWRRISEDEHIQAAARGWARYIENHYSVTNASIRLESKGLQSYLVEATEGFFLFAENLRHGRFVSQSAQGALHNLQTSPPTFEGAETLMAAESPTSVGLQRDAPPVDMDVKMD